MARQLLAMDAEQLLFDLLRLSAVEIASIGHARNERLRDIEPSHAF